MVPLHTALNPNRFFLFGLIQLQACTLALQFPSQSNQGAPENVSENCYAKPAHLKSELGCSQNLQFLFLSPFLPFQSFERVADANKSAFSANFVNNFLAKTLLCGPPKADYSVQCPRASRHNPDQGGTIQVPQQVLDSEFGFEVKLDCNSVPPLPPPPTHTHIHTHQSWRLFTPT